MKKLLLGLCVFGAVQLNFAFAQTLLHFDAPISFDSLEMRHKSAIHVNPGEGVFDDQEAWVLEYKRLHAELAKQLKAGGLELDEKIQLHMRLYFEANGRIGHLFYQHQQGDLTEKQAQLFEQLIKDFAREFQLEKTAEVPFKQCGPVLIQANNDKSPGKQGF